MASADLKQKSAAEDLTLYQTPSAYNSQVISFHPSFTGASARYSLLFESVVGTIEGLAIIYYASPIFNFMASESTPHSAIGTSYTQIVGGVIIGLHLPLALGVPNRRTNVEARVVVSAYFEVFEYVIASVMLWLAWKGEKETGFRPDRLCMVAGVALFFAVFRGVTYRKTGWAGVYR